jgi:hypothetical protein
MGWPVWAVLRVVGFVATGIAMAALGLSWLEKARGRKVHVDFPTRVFLFGLALVVADAVLKALLAPAWQRILARGLEAGS